MTNEELEQKIQSVLIQLDELYPDLVEHKNEQRVINFLDKLNEISVSM